jgi:hypothetical protein
MALAPTTQVMPVFVGVGHKNGVFVQSEGDTIPFQGTMATIKKAPALESRDRLF